MKLRYVLFPYERIKMGSRVALYGYGFVGHLFLQQVRETGYCELKCIADRRHEYLECADLPLVSVAELVRQAEELDYVVIALIDAAESGRVRENLLSVGIPATRIICGGNLLYFEDEAVRDSSLEEMHKCAELLKDSRQRIKALEQKVTETQKYLSNKVQPVLRDLDAYALNDFFVQQCPTWSEEYGVKRLRCLKELLRVREIVQPHRLYRVGNSADGGYAIVDNCPRGGGDRILYSFGIAGDVTFEAELARQGYEAYMYDHTVNGLPQNDPHFHFFKQGLAGVKDSVHPEFATLPELLYKNGHMDKHELMLKMDIEGWERGVFIHLTEDIQDRFAQIVLEWHGFTVEERQDELLLALQSLNRTHQLVHLHANNWGSLIYRGDVRLADCYEATYVRRRDYAFRDIRGPLTIDADRRCNIARHEWLTWQ